MKKNMTDEMEKTKEENFKLELPETRKHGKYRHTIAFFSLLIVITAGVLLVHVSNKSNVVISDIEEKEPVHANPFDSVHIQAKAVYVYDVASGEVLFAKNKEHQLPLASLTKLITSIVAAELFESEELVHIAPSALLQEGDSGLFANETWKAEDLISFTLITSSNDGAAALANVISSRGSPQGLDGSTTDIADILNRKVAEIGMVQTYFINETGLDENTNFSGAYGSARDTAILFEYILRHSPRILEGTRQEKTTFVSLDNFYHEAENTNISVTAIPGLIGGKTGFTDLAGGNLVIAFDMGLNRPVIISVLGSTLEGRFRDVETLAAAVRVLFKNR